MLLGNFYLISKLCLVTGFVDFEKFYWFCYQVKFEKFVETSTVARLFASPFLLGKGFFSCYVFIKIFYVSLG